jgi:uncharacterized membrane protein
MTESTNEMRRIAACLSYNDGSTSAKAKHLLLAAASELDQLRAQLKGFTSVDALRQCMVDTADENKALRAQLAKAEAELHAPPYKVNE